MLRDVCQAVCLIAGQVESLVLITRLVSHEPVVDLLVGRGGDQTDQAEDDDPDPGHEERPPADPVDQQEGDGRGDHLDQPEEDGGKSCQSVSTKPH